MAVGTLPSPPPVHYAHHPGQPVFDESPLHRSVSMGPHSWPPHHTKPLYDATSALIGHNMHFDAVPRTCNFEYAATPVPDCGFQFGIHPSMMPVPCTWEMPPVEQEQFHSSYAPHFLPVDHDLPHASYYQYDRSVPLSRSTANSSMSSLSGMTSQLSDVSELSSGSRYDSDQDSPQHTSFSSSPAITPAQAEVTEPNAGPVIHSEAEFQRWCDKQFGPRSRSSTSESVIASDSLPTHIPQLAPETAFVGFPNQSHALAGSFQGLHMATAMQSPMYSGQGVTPSALTSLPPLSISPTNTSVGLCISPLVASFSNLDATAMSASPMTLSHEEFCMMSQQSNTRSLHTRANSVILAAGGRQIQAQSAGLSRSLTDQGQITPRAHSMSTEYFATPMRRSQKMRSNSQGGDSRRGSCLLDTVASDRQRTMSANHIKSPAKRQVALRLDRGVEAQFVCGMMVPGQSEPCMKAYKRTEHLKRHQISHETVKPYACPLCDRPFDRTDNLNQHIKTHQNKDGRNTKLLKAKLEREREMAEAEAAAAASMSTPAVPSPPEEGLS